MKLADDDVSEADMRELDSSKVDSVSSRAEIAASVVSSLETSSEQPANDADDKNVAALSTGVSDSVECVDSDARSDLNGRSPSHLVIDLPSDAAAAEVGLSAAERLGVAETAIARTAVCESDDEMICESVVTESLAPSSDHFPPAAVLLAIAPTDQLDAVICTDDPNGMQLDIAECVEIGPAD